MGGELFDEFPEITAQADAILGYSVKTLCMENPERRLSQTQFTQPAIYTVNALTYRKKLKETAREPDFVAGHSLGEYNALLAAGAFSFGTGLELVKKRGELMSRATGGGLAAVIGLSSEKVAEVLSRNEVDSIDIANFNAVHQTVLSGEKSEIRRVSGLFDQEGVKYVVLNVSGAFHSRHMKPAQDAFGEFLDTFSFSPLTIPVISNVSARPYRQLEVKQNLLEQITRSVQWTETVRYLMGQGEKEFQEIGPGTVLTRLVETIRKEAEPLVM